MEKLNYNKVTMNKIIATLRLLQTKNTNFAKKELDLKMGYVFVNVNLTSLSLAATLIEILCFCLWLCRREEHSSESDTHP